MSDPLERLSGARILVLNWRDIRHPQAGGAEQYMHQIARRWAAAGARVTWLAARPKGQPEREVVDGIEIHRAGGPLTLYPRVAARLARTLGEVDYIVDCQNGIPFFSPLFVGPAVPVVQVVHHVHQDQFATRFGPALATLGRFLEGPVARRVYRHRPIAAVSPSTRQELRRRLDVRGPIHIVPNGAESVPTVRAGRDLAPTIAVVSRLVPHKRIDLLLTALVRTAAAVPELRVDIVGDGPELPRLRQLALDLGLGEVVTFHGYQPDAVRDELLRRAWLTTVTSAGEGWGCSVIEAAAHGVPTLAVRAPGVRDSVVHDRTGWLVDRDDFSEATTAALRELADGTRAAALADACRAWAQCFSWDRSAALLAGVLGEAAVPRSGSRRRVRSARSDIAAVARFPLPPGWAGPGLARLLRPTDQVAIRDGQVGLLLSGCDEVDAAVVLRRLGITAAQIRLADRHDLLAGPAGMPPGLADTVDDGTAGSGAGGRVHSGVAA
jgi:glycosyltransferase involved in cell wall biosynthesis